MSYDRKKDTLELLEKIKRYVQSKESESIPDWITAELEDIVFFIDIPVKGGV